MVRWSSTWLFSPPDLPEEDFYKSSGRMKNKICQWADEISYRVRGNQVHTWYQDFYELSILKKVILI